MALTPGTRLGPYEIDTLLGAGGMGEVYKARDTRLDRTVAVKILPSALAADPQFRERFDREARAISQLTHPHICTLHDVGEHNGTAFLVMELLDGETLADRLTKGALQLAEALKTAVQIADALDAAHRRGVVHRDLKPGNVMLTKAGAKLLDFGLAKASGPTIASAGPSMLPTTPANLTAQGTILGTFQYMAPEQLEGREADTRTDIFAFGAVLYEVFTGKKAFEGRSQATLVAAIISSDPPPVSQLQPLVPIELDRIVATCLAKDPDDRWQSARDIERELKWIADAPKVQTESTSTVVRRRMRRAAAWVGSVIVCGIAAGLAVWSLTRPRTAVTRAVTRSVIAVPRGMQLVDASTVALSPDGRTAVFAAEDGDSRLYLRPLDRLTATPIAGTDGAEDPFFSPDGRWVGFWSQDKIKKVAVTGGAPQVVCDAAGIGVIAPVWGDDGTMVFASTSGAGLLRVSSNGGASQVLTTPNRGEHEKTHRLPEVLPGGRAVLMTVGTADITTFDDARIEAVTPATGQRKVLIRGGMNARYVSTGHLVYARSGSLLAVPFDVDRLEVTGPPVALVDDVWTDPASGIAIFAISHDGSLMFAPGGAFRRDSALLWVDRQGRTEPVTDARRPFVFPRLSPDGQHIAVTVNEATSEIWVYDATRTTSTRLVYGWDNGQPVWSPDGLRLAFNSNRGASGGRNLFVQSADGTGTAERLTPDALVFQTAQSWSPDGRFLVFTQNGPSTSADLWIMAVDERKPRPLLQTPAAELNAKISPDGRWIAYQSDQSGRFEVYVQAFPGPSRRWQVSTDGGRIPMWAPGGRELFYRGGNEMMAVDIAATAEFSAGRPKRLFDASKFQNPYDVARDGRFLMIQDVERTPITQLNLVQNWAEELRARAPTK